MTRHSLPGKQTGVSLIVTLLITVLLSLLALYGAGVLVLDTRSAANDYGMLARQDLVNSSVTTPTDQQGFTTRLDVEDALPEDGFLFPEGLDEDALRVVPKRLTVTVTWQDATGPKVYTLRTVRLVPPAEEDL